MNNSEPFDLDIARFSFIQVIPKSLRSFSENVFLSIGESILGTSVLK